MDEVALLAQEAPTAPCGSGMDVSLICLLVRQFTDDDIALGLANALGIVIRILVIMLLAYVATRVARSILGRFGKRMERRIELRLQRGEKRGTLDASRYRSRRFQRLNATIGVVRGVVGVVIWMIAVLLIVDSFGISMQPVLAGAGLASVVIGFGAQQLVRDVIAGIAMLIEDQYGVGDWIEVDGVIGMVEKVGIRATSFRDLDGVLHHVLNGHVQRIGNLSQEWSRSILDVPIALDSDVPSAKSLILKVATELAEDPVWGEDVIGPPEVWGVQEFGPEGLAIRVSMPTKPMANWDVNRQMRERLQHAFERAHIRMQGKLVEVGGMETGYPIVHHPQTSDERIGSRPHRRGPLPPYIGPLDHREEEREQHERDADGHDTEVVDHGDIDPPEPDMTTELRIERGSEPRPD